jgi:hypothetical protein
MTAILIELVVGKNRSALCKKNPAIGQIENGDTHHAIESVGDAADASLELFPKQIAAGVARSGLAILLAESIRRAHEGNGQCSVPMCRYSPQHNCRVECNFRAQRRVAFTAESQIPRAVSDSFRLC